MASRRDPKRPRYRIRPGQPNTELENRIVQVLDESEVGIVYADFWNWHERVEKGLGLYFGAAGIILLEIFKKLARDGRIAAYHSNGGKTSRDIIDVEFFSLSLWETEARKMPELELQREWFREVEEYRLVLVPVRRSESQP